MNSAHIEKKHKAIKAYKSHSKDLDVHQSTIRQSTNGGTTKLLGFGTAHSEGAMHNVKTTDEEPPGNSKAHGRMSSTC